MSFTVSKNEEGSKKALLIGVNYRRSRRYSELRGCHNDVRKFKQALVERFGFQEENITVLIDTDTSDTQPIGDNIRAALDKLVMSAKPHDILFVLFCGHGKRQTSQAEDDDTGYDEYIVAADGEPITDDDFNSYVNQLPEDCSITIVADCCHSGGLIEAAKEQIGDSTKENHQYSRDDSEETIYFPPEDNSYEGYRILTPPSRSKMRINKRSRPSTSSSPDRGILLSACQSYQRAKEREFSGTVYGVFTNALMTVIEQTRGRVTNWNLVHRATKILARQRFTQEPGLYCNDLHADAFFLL